MSAFGQWIFDWQTLLTGGAALAVGSVSVWMLHRQINQQEHLHELTRASRFAVAKAKTPLAAIEISHNAKIYWAEIEKLIPLVLERSREEFRFFGPPFPPKAESILDSLVESTDDTVIIDSISALYSEHQVMSSRLVLISEPAQHSLTIDDYILQPIMMDAIAMNLLAFGRDGQTMQYLTWDDIDTSVRHLIANGPTRSRVTEYIAGKRERGRPVPLALRRHVSE